MEKQLWSNNTREIKCEYGYNSSATLEIITVKNYGAKLVVNKQQQKKTYHNMIINIYVKVIFWIMYVNIRRQAEPL